MERTQKGTKGGRGGDGLRAEVVDEDGGRLRHGGDGVFLDDGVGREDAFCEALDHGAGQAEVLHVWMFALSVELDDDGCGACVKRGGGGWAGRYESVCSGVFLCV